MSLKLKSTWIGTGAWNTFAGFVNDVARRVSKVVVNGPGYGEWRSDGLYIDLYQGTERTRSFGYTLSADVITVLTGYVWFHGQQVVTVAEDDLTVVSDPAYIYVEILRGITGGITCSIKQSASLPSATSATAINWALYKVALADSTVSMTQILWNGGDIHIGAQLPA